MTSMKLAAGMSISFTYSGKQLTGTIIKEDQNVKRSGDRELTIKLDSGYNIVAAKADLKDVKEAKVPAKERNKKPSSQRKAAGEKAYAKLPTIAVLHTGGTIASKVDYNTGAVIAQYSADDLLELFPELLKIANIKSKLIANMQSEMMRFAHWNMIAKAVAAEARDGGVDGVIVTHGTDIMHMTGAALTFALDGISIPVLLVGSQRSSDRPSSDAASNLLCAAQFIAQNKKQNKKKFSGVALCMHEGVEKDDCVILPGARSRKMHTSRRDAFRPINDAPFARISYPGLKVESLRDYPASPAGGEETTLAKLEVKPFNEKLKIGLLNVHPQMYASELDVYNKFDGLVLGLLGIGHAPTMKTDASNAEHEKIMEAIAGLAKKLPVAAAPQTIYGRLNMNVYSPGRQLLEAGVLGQGLDMTPETAFVKLAWLLSNYDKKETRILFGKNLRGELSERSEKEGFSE